MLGSGDAIGGVTPLTTDRGDHLRDTSPSPLPPRRCSMSSARLQRNGDKGRTLGPLLRMLLDWGNKHTR
jgi:hypothetical protein